MKGCPDTITIAGECHSADFRCPHCGTCLQCAHSRAEILADVWRWFWRCADGRARLVDRMVCANCHSGCAAMRRRLIG